MGAKRRGIRPRLKSTKSGSVSQHRTDGATSSLDWTRQRKRQAEGRKEATMEAGPVEANQMEIQHSSVRCLEEAFLRSIPSVTVWWFLRRYRYWPFLTRRRQIKRSCGCK